MELTEKAITGIEILKKIEKITDLRTRLEYYSVWISEIMTAEDEDTEDEDAYSDYVQDSDILKRANKLLLKEMEISEISENDEVYDLILTEEEEKVISELVKDLILTEEEEKVISELVKEKVFYNCDLILDLSAL